MTLILQIPFPQELNQITRKTLKDLATLTLYYRAPLFQLLLIYIGEEAK